jgi:hypothetical protein
MRGLIVIAICALMIVSVWKIFTKAGKPGWACLIPFYNFIVLLEILNRPWWWMFLLLIPIVNLGFAGVMCIDLARAFGKKPEFGFGIFFLCFIFYPILAFGDARYMGAPAR